VVAKMKKCNNYHTRQQETYRKFLKKKILGKKHKNIQGNETDMLTKKSKYDLLAST
jgi:hypothetical protein